METEKDVKEVCVPVGKCRHLWRIVTDLLLFAAIFGIIMILGNAPFSFLFEDMEPKNLAADMPLLILSETVMLISGFLAAWIVLRIRGLSLAALGLSLKGRWGDVLSGIMFAAVLYAVGFGLSLMLGAVEITGFAFQPSFLLLSLGFFLLVGITEELMIRGFVLGHMMDGGVNKFVALVVSSVIFSLMHLFNPNFAFVPFLNIMLAGVFLGASYIYTRNLCFPIALHWFWNWLQGPVLGYEVSGVKFGDSLVKLQLTEANLINGGTFGFEGSVLCTVLMLIGTVVIVRISTSTALKSVS